MTRLRPSTIRGASGEQLLMLSICFGDQLKDEVNQELDRRASLRPAIFNLRKVNTGDHGRQAA